MDDRQHSSAPPHDQDAEKAVLGAALRDPDHLNLITEQLKPEHFYLEVHRKIFQAMIELYTRNEPADLITVVDALKASGVQDSEIGVGYLAELMESAPVTQNIEYHAKIVRELHYRRRIITKCLETAHRAQTFEGKTSAFVEDIEKEFLEITNEQDRAGLVEIGAALESTLVDLEARLSQDSQLTGVPTDFSDLDNITGGWQKSDLVILAARPGMGKTAFVLNVVANAVRNGHPTAMFTLEMSKEQLTMRLLGSEARIDQSRLRKGDLTEDEQNQLMHGFRVLGTLPASLQIDETPGINLMELRSRCRRMKKEHGLGLIVIDYLQLMTGSGSQQSQGSREREISEISGGLKALAKELAVPVIALAQLNRGPDTRPDKIPKLSDLRESGSMEQDADMIIFLYRDEYYNPNSEDAGKALVKIAKNRHGSTEDVYLAFAPQFMKFTNLQYD